MPWDGPLAGAVRRLTYRTTTRLYAAGALMFGLASISIGILLPLGDNRACLIFVVAGTALTSLGLLGSLLFVDPVYALRYTPVLGIISLPLATALTTVSLIGGGTKLLPVASIYVEAPLFGFYIFHRWLAAALVTLVAVEFGVVLAVLHVPAHLATGLWFIVVSTVGATGIVVGGIAARAEELGASEREARAALSELNVTLERRVSDQVEELDRLGKMRRFLSPQVADAVVSGGSDDVLQPHRRRIAVLFCDLRGFTAFTNGAEPEEVVQVLDEYYETAGAILQQNDATIGGYSGDGIMAYFGDPVVRESPALDAVTAAQLLSPALTRLSREWSERGHRLGFGIGLAFGYATLGVVGFDGRYDYTPLGAVVNLAARLCAKAEGGQVLLDQAVYREIADSHDVLELEGFELKGFGSDIRVYALGTPDPIKSSATLLRLRRPG